MYVCADGNRNYAEIKVRVPLDVLVEGVQPTVKNRQPGMFHMTFKHLFEN